MKETTKQARGRPIALYFLPTVLVAVVLAGALFFIIGIQGRAVEKANAERGASLIADVLVARVEELLQIRREQLGLLVSRGDIAGLLTAGDGAALRSMETALQASLRGSRAVRILPASWDQAETGGDTPIAYAGLDLLRRTVDSGMPQPVEMHRLESASPYIAMAYPIAEGDRVLGTLFVAWSARVIQDVISLVADFPGQMWLEQGYAGGYVLAHSAAAGASQPADQHRPIAGSIWQLAYHVDPTVGMLGGFGGGRMLAAVLAGGALAIILAVLLQWRLLQHDLRGDMATLVRLAESAGRGTAQHGVYTRLRELHDAALLIAATGGQNKPKRTAGARAAAVADELESPPPAQTIASQEVVPRSRLRATSMLMPATAAAAAGVGMEELPAMTVAPEVFRAYDIRGRVGAGLDADFAELLGRALGSMVSEAGGHEVVLARDARLSSPMLGEALAAGLQATGCHVTDLGLVPTPVLYFGVEQLGAAAGVMVTGSHNPPDDNGFKIVLEGRTLDGEALSRLRERMLNGPFSVGKGVRDMQDVRADYCEQAAAAAQLARPLKVVVDGGNGAAGELATTLYRQLGCEVVCLFCEPDGNFPNHHPDPSQLDNLTALALEVQAQEADLGLAFDGDGDRLGVIDNTGGMIWPDRVFMLLAADILDRHPGVDVIYDVKCSRHVAAFVLARGGRPIMWKSGHSRMRGKMRDTGALIGGELSGHIFIKERWFGFDDAVYAGARLLELLALDARSSAEVFAEVPYGYATPEYLLPLAEGQSAELMIALRGHAQFNEARLIDLDGLRFEFADSWGLVRASNTTPSLTFRFEGDTEAALEQVKARFRALMTKAAPTLTPPF